VRQILFIQGGGARVHDEWDDKLVDSLRRALGPKWDVRYPRMPDEADPSYPKWKTAIAREIAGLDEGAVLAGHSIGGTMLIQTLAEDPPKQRPGAIMLMSAPFIGEGGWESDDISPTPDLGARLPKGVSVHVFHGCEDETAPSAHAHLYSRAIPQAQVHLLPERDHQLNNDLSDVADVVAELA
jgi:predicted alpha/beta hydrolase family esterase